VKERRKDRRKEKKKGKGKGGEIRNKKTRKGEKGKKQ